MEDEKVVNNPPSASRARVVCSQTSSQTGYVNISLCSQTTPARVRVREAMPPIADRAAYFKAWREGRFGGDFDPVEAAVDEAVAKFSTKTPDDDRRIWLKIANRVGFENFLDAIDQKRAEIRELEQHGRRLRDKAASFQKLLNRRFPKGGVA